jgi:hypothetical protein
MDESRMPEDSDTGADLEAAIARWRTSGAFDAGTQDELETHLRDACADAMARGSNQTDAFSEAIMRLGDSTRLAGEFWKVREPRHLNTMPTPLLRTPYLRRLGRRLAIAVALVVPLRLFVLAPYRAVGACVAPEILPGSRVLAWCIAPQFAPGDIAVYRKGDFAYLGRVTAVNESGLTVARANESEKAVARANIIGRVILTTR